MKNINITLIRKPEALKKLGISKSTFHIRIAEGLLPPAVMISQRAKGYLLHEINSVIVSMVKGKSNQEIKALVLDLIEQRQELLGDRS